MSDTPITDSAAWNPQGTDVWQVVVPVDTSRKLERMCNEFHLLIKRHMIAQKMTGSTSGLDEPMQAALDCWQAMKEQK